MKKTSMKGRMRIAIIAMACMLAVLAVPAAAHAASSFNPYPANGATLVGSPVMVGADVINPAALSVSDAAIQIDGAAFAKAVVLGQGSVTGGWNAEEQTLSNGMVVIKWVWHAQAADATKATMYILPGTPLSVGSHNVVAKINGETSSWSFTVNAAAPTFSAVSPGPGASVSTLSNIPVSITFAAPAGISGVTINGAAATIAGNVASGVLAGPYAAGDVVTVDVVITDAAANTATAKWSFTISGSTAKGDCQSGSCHAGYDRKPGMTANCVSCHPAPAHGLQGQVPHAAIPVGDSGTCVACHGRDFKNIALVTPQQHTGCSCHAYFEADAPKMCKDCHVGAYGPHGFASGPAHGVGYIPAGGHNASPYNVNGAKTKFDGSQGVTLTWTASQAFTVSTAKAPAAMAPGFGPGTAVAAGQTGVVNTNWDFPTKSVFWPAGDPTAPATAITGLTKDSVIGCNDCHEALTDVGGAHGAAQNWGLDTDYPADYSRAGLTKKVTSGGTMASGAFSPSGIMVGDVSNGKTSWAVTANWKSGTSGSDAVICAKCHKLMTVMPKDPTAVGTAWGTTAGTSGRSWDVVVGANTPHNSHHQDATDGSNQCVSCHVATPHGWKAPRLLVDLPDNVGNEYAESPNILEEMGTLAALNNHPLVPADGTLAFSTSDGSVLAAGAGTSIDVSRAGTVLWDESQCDACGDHYGNSTASGGSMAVPARIDQR